ncbi:hypothetical protein DL766_006823 [Monosporascus sp. MC13-8B]|uniref:Uncharacterized protein n=1 Tax=Monosporascus cannonballus TaxID=155416 RepID=A0ABY0H2V4_9PEZI|nr:hypothetical protein DL762_006163 [Monosporascus cannonballus]RYO90970.1 hypothetical protein DL763_005141 [Monosporascus cannonballus]RYP26150.1 hypothetical protein DL766_006823 [Monosporascus sp. MC13-8B]
MKPATVSSTFLSILSLVSATRWKVEIDYTRAEPCVDGNDILYADDLTGCSVVAASWPESDRGKWGASTHLCGSIIEDADEFQRIIQEDGRGYEGLSMADSWDFLGDDLGQPESIYLIGSVDSSGNENFPTGNQRIRDFLQNDAGITAAINQDHTYTGNGNEATAELQPVGREPDLALPVLGGRIFASTMGLATSDQRMGGLVH